MKRSNCLFRVFVVDDECTIAQTTALILSREGFEAIPFTDPQLLLKFARVNPPDLVISDIIMPQMNGFELADSMKRLLPCCHVILFTGQAGVADLRGLAGEQGHVLDVLSKPVQPAELIATVRGLASEQDVQIVIS